MTEGIYYIIIDIYQLEAASTKFYTGEVHCEQVGLKETALTKKKKKEKEEKTEQNCSITHPGILHGNDTLG